MRVIKGETCRGIQCGFRTCLRGSHRRLDRPDRRRRCPRVDALGVMASTIASVPADFVFSDEDHLVDGQLRSRYVRPGFDQSSTSRAHTSGTCPRSVAIAPWPLARTDSGAEFCRLGFEHAIRSGGRDDGARTSRLVPLAQPRRVLEPSRDAESRTVVSTRAVLERVVADNLHTLALRSPSIRSIAVPLNGGYDVARSTLRRLAS